MAKPMREPPKRVGKTKLAIMHLLTKNSSMGTFEIARELGVVKASALRTIKTLQQDGWVTKEILEWKLTDEGRERYEEALAIQLDRARTEKRRVAERLRRLEDLTD